MTKKHPGCWCGNKRLLEFSPDYFRCPKCETLVIKAFPSGDLSRVTNEETDLYGANYAERHLSADHGQPEFAVRSRQDLTERCVFWLRTLLRHKTPPASLLELGGFHGGFVGLAKLAGYEACGLEISPALAQKAADAFDVTVLAGPLDDQPIPAGSLDIIALFDVLEHLQDPRALFQRCRKLLRPNGLLVIQTPCYTEGRTLAAMIESKDPFLPLFIPEHLYLFSQTAVRRLLSETGFPHVSFEPAVFGQYDMFPFASGLPLVTIDKPAQEAALLSTAGGRFATALLDLKASADQLLEESRRLHLHAERCEQDAVARTSQVKQLTQLAKSHEKESAERAVQVDKLTQLAKSYEKESAERAVQVDKLTAMVNEREARLSQLHDELLKVNQLAQAALAEKDLFLQSVLAQLATMGNEVQTRDLTIARLDQDVGTLNQLIHSGQLTAELEASLRRAQLENALTSQLLSLSCTLPAASPTRWIQLPPAILPGAPPAPVISHLETVERGPHTTRISGWAFADAPMAVASEPPCLIFSTPLALWLLRGVAIERPDVAAAYPAEGVAATARFRSGFVFEFPTNQLPGPVVENLQVVFGQVSGVPVMTPPFPLP